MSEPAGAEENWGQEKYNGRGGGGVAGLLKPNVPSWPA